MKLTKLETEVLRMLAANTPPPESHKRAWWSVVKKGAFKVGWFGRGLECRITPAGRAYLATIDAKEAAK